MVTLAIVVEGFGERSVEDSNRGESDRLAAEPLVEPLDSPLTWPFWANTSIESV